MGLPHVGADGGAVRGVPGLHAWLGHASGGGDDASIGGVVDGHRLEVVSGGHGPHGGPRSHVPDPHGAIAGGRGEVRSVGRELDVVDHVGVSDEGPDESSRCGVPHADGGGGVAPGHDVLPVGRERDGIPRHPAHRDRTEERSVCDVPEVDIADPGGGGNGCAVRGKGEAGHRVVPGEGEEVGDEGPDELTVAGAPEFGASVVGAAREERSIRRVRETGGESRVSTPCPDEVGCFLGGNARGGGEREHRDGADQRGEASERIEGGARSSGSRGRRDEAAGGGTGPPGRRWRGISTSREASRRQDATSIRGNAGGEVGQAS